MTEKTKELLLACKKAGYTRIAIGVCDKRIRRCIGWPFSYSGSVFCSPEKRIDGWPAIWSIVKECGIEMSCGNGQQAQIVRPNKLTQGTYKLSMISKETPCTHA